MLHKYADFKRDEFEDPHFYSNHKYFYSISIYRATEVNSIIGK